MDDGQFLPKAQQLQLLGFCIPLRLCIHPAWDLYLVAGHWQKHKLFL